MSDSAHPRPPQVTLAGWVTIVGSFFMVFSVWDVVTNLRSIDTRESVTRALSEPPLDGTGLGVETALDLMHITALVAAACAAAAGILGVFVLQKHRQARLALTLLALPLFLSGMITGGFLSALIAVSIVMLWSGPARDWYDGRAPRQPVRRDRDVATDGRGDDASRRPDPFATPPHSPGHSPHHPPGQPGAVPPPSGQAVDLPPPPSGPPAYSGFGDPARHGSVPIATAPAPAMPSSPYVQQPSPAARRPPAVLWACLITWVMAGSAALLMLMVAAVFAGDSSVLRDAYEQNDQISESGMTLDEVRQSGMLVATVFGLWSLVAVVFAVFAFLRHGWARMALLISAGAAGGVVIVAATVSPALAIVAVGMLAVVWMLSRPDVRAWFVSR